MELKLKPFKEWVWRESDISMFLLLFMHIGISFVILFLFYLIISSISLPVSMSVKVTVCTLCTVLLFLIALFWFDLTGELYKDYKKWKARNMCLTVFEIQQSQRNPSSVLQRTEMKIRFLA